MNERSRPDRDSHHRPLGRVAEGFDVPPPGYKPPGKPDFLGPESRRPTELRPTEKSRTFNGRELPRAEVLRERARRGEWDTDIWLQQMIDAGFARTDQDMRMSRRAFLKLGGAVAISLAGVGALDHFYFKNLAKFLDERTGKPQYDYDAAINEARTFIKTVYGANLIVGVEKEQKEQKEVEGKHTAIEKCRVTMRLLMQEIKRYPPEMILKIGEGRGFEIRIADDLKARTGNPQNKAERWTYGGIAPLLKTGKPASITLSTQEIESQQRVNFHHELNHRFAEKFQNPHERNEKWKAMHQGITGDPYIGYTAARDGNELASPGYFLKRYASAAPIEDQAVCAEFIMTPKLHAAFKELIQAMPEGRTRIILQAKYDETIKNYFDWSDGKLDEGFWLNIIAESAPGRTP